MLTGRLPFAADTPVALLVQRLQVQPMPPDRVRPDLNISLDVSKLVMEAIEKERENRYRSAEEMERAIAAVLEAEEVHPMEAVEKMLLLLPRVLLETITAMEEREV